MVRNACGRAVAAVLALGLAAGPGTRRADADPPLAPITNRNYAIDLYDGVAIGNTAVVGMGGAAVALAVGSSGTLVNPSAPAVRPTTDLDSWSWDYHLDYLNASLSSDYGNTGLSRSDGGTSILTGGLAIRVHDWAGALTITDTYAPVSGSSAGTPQGLVVSALQFQAAVATWMPRFDVAFGGAIQSAQVELKPNCSGPGCGPVFNIAGAGLEAGATWIPQLESWRVGAALATPIAGGTITSSCTDYTSCDGFMLPERVVSAWRVATGVAYRFAATPWNELVRKWFRDEPALTLAADLVITGPSPDAYGLEAFGQMQLERSGRHAAYSPRAGAEYEWIPGRLRLRAGSYWEPGRFEGVSGRIHGTFGTEVRAFEFWFWGSMRRGKLSLTADVAPRYRNIGLSIGFWH